MMESGCAGCPGASGLTSACPNNLCRSWDFGDMQPPETRSFTHKMPIPVPKPIICVPIMARDTEAALVKMAQAASVADMMEIRLDAMESFDLAAMIGAAGKPVLVTYRSTGEGGKGAADFETVTRRLRDAVEAGAFWVDLEYGMPDAFRRRVLDAGKSVGVVLSRHILDGTPSEQELDELLEEMIAAGADIIKIVTLARSWADILRVLGLIPKAHASGVRIAAFAMGPVGRISRVLAHLMGSAFTFASLGTGEESASGQIPVQDMKRLLEFFSP